LKANPTLDSYRFEVRLLASTGALNLNEEFGPAVGTNVALREIEPRVAGFHEHVAEYVLGVTPVLVTVCTDTQPGMRLPFAKKVTLPVVDVAAVSDVGKRKVVFAGIVIVTLELSGVVGVTGIFI